MTRSSDPDPAPERESQPPFIPLRSAVIGAISLFIGTGMGELSYLARHSPADSLIAGLTAAAVLLNCRFWLLTRRLVRERKAEASAPQVAGEAASGVAVKVS